MQASPRYEDVVGGGALPRGAARASPSRRASPRSGSASIRVSASARRSAQNFELVRRLDVIARLGRPVVVGFSRKSSLGPLLGDPDATHRASLREPRGRGGCVRARRDDPPGARRSRERRGAHGRASGRRGLVTRAYVGLGSNLGDREAMLARAARSARRCRHRGRSRCRRFRETDPVGFVDQPRFLNGAAVLETELSARELLARLLAIERRSAGRATGPRFGPRTIDLDLLLYGDETHRRAGAEVPHPRLTNGGSRSSRSSSSTRSS